jgi:D-proline reductase (dithiol) PrdB
MCNQSVGLIQRAIEAEGIPTISISLNLTITEKVKPPRALLVAFPLGHPMGNPFDKGLQKEILMKGLRHLREISRPATIIDLTGTYHIEAKKCTLCTVGVA